jgi:uncharacterized RDD family membrane protein YckC
VSEPLGPDALVPAEARAHQGHRAGFVSRSLAAGLDLVVVVCLLGLAYVGVCVVLFVIDPHAFDFPAPSTRLQVASYVGGSVAYLTICWSVMGSTPGQNVLGLRVLGVAGDRPRFLVALLRAVLCVVFPIGLLGVLLSPRRRAFHDVVARTTVTYAWAHAHAPH